MNIKNPRKSLESSIIIFLTWTNFYFILSLIECAEFCFKTWVSGVKFNLRIFSLYPFRDENYQAGTDFSIPSFNGAIVLKKVFVLCCLDIQTSSAWTVSSKLGVTCFKKKMREWERKEISLLWCISLQCAGALQLHGRENAFRNIMQVWIILSRRLLANCTTGFVRWTWTGPSALPRFPLHTLVYHPGAFTILTVV